MTKVVRNYFMLTVDYEIFQGSHLLESMDGDEHKAESLFKMFQKYLSKTPNWNPETVSQKLNLKSDNVWKSKTGSVHATCCLIEEPRFENALKSGVNFISCIQTKNLVARDAENQPELCQYLTHQYDDQFTWCVGRACPNPKNFASRDYCNTYIDISDLNFGSDRRNQIAALCPIKDILMTITFEEKNKVSILFNPEYLKTKNHRGKKCLLQATSKKNFWKVKNNSNADKENQFPINPGPSGLNSTRSDMSQEPNVPQSFEINLDESLIHDPQNDEHSETTRLSSGISTSDQSQSQTVRTEQSTEKQTDFEGPADEADATFDDTRSIVFKHNHAEVTSNGITRKIEIANRTDYPNLVDKVGF